MRKFNKYSLLVLLFSSAFFFSCEDEAMEQVVVGITNGKGVIVPEDSTGSVEMEIRLARPASTQSGVFLSFSSESAEYGRNFVTTPRVLNNNRLRIDFQPGETVAKVSFSPIVDGEFTQGHVVTVKIDDTFGEILSTVNNEFKVVIEESDVPPTLALFDFENCPGNFLAPIGFEVDSVEGFKADRLWGCTGFGNNGTQGVQVNGFAGNPGASNAWLILELDSTQNLQGGGNIDSETLEGLYVEFGAQSFFGGPGTIRLKWSTDYRESMSPDEANWTEVESLQESLPESGSREWKTVFAELEGAAGKSNVSIALQYVDASTGAAASWTIDDFKVLGN